MNEQPLKARYTLTVARAMADCAALHRNAPPRRSRQPRYAAAGAPVEAAGENAPNGTWSPTSEDYDALKNVIWIASMLPEAAQTGLDLTEDWGG